jgi:hypothetical protein
VAKPPEPLAEMLPLATLVVEASVVEVKRTGPPQPRPPNADEHRDVGTMSPDQDLVLEIVRVLKGSHADKMITVTKPIAPYAVKVGTKGAWLLDDKNVILGRYGPDSWHISRVEAALKT